MRGEGFTPPTSAGFHLDSGLGPHQAKSPLGRQGPFQGDCSVVWHGLGLCASCTHLHPSGQASNEHPEAAPGQRLLASLITP